MAKKLTSKAFFNLLRRRRRDNADEIDARIEKGGVAELSVLMSDSSGFSRKTREYGIIQFLAVMTQCYDKLIPLLESHRGVCISNNADNILAVFAEPKDAVRAAMDMHRWLAKRNETLSDMEQFNVCIGIHHGKLLRLTDNVYGATVNVAAKMGEDIAARDEIIVTQQVAKRLGRGFDLKFSRTENIGGRNFDLHSVRY